MAQKLKNNISQTQRIACFNEWRKERGYPKRTEAKAETIEATHKKFNKKSR